jgi:hypothetical protein
MNISGACFFVPFFLVVWTILKIWKLYWLRLIGREPKKLAYKSMHHRVHKLIFLFWYLSEKAITTNINRMSINFAEDSQFKDKLYEETGAYQHPSYSYICIMLNQHKPVKKLNRQPPREMRCWLRGSEATTWSGEASPATSEPGVWAARSCWQLQPLTPAKVLFIPLPDWRPHEEKERSQQRKFWRVRRRGRGRREGETKPELDCASPCTEVVELSWAPALDVHPPAWSLGAPTTHSSWRCRALSCSLQFVCVSL